MKMTLREWMDEMDFESIHEVVEEMGDELMDSIVPALCTNGCEVEPDGICPHGGKSVLLAMGMI